MTNDSHPDATQSFHEHWYEAAAAEQSRSWKAGAGRFVEDLIAGVSLTQRSTECLLDLIQSEVVFREAVGQTVSLAEYQARFPELAKALKIQFDLARMLDTNAESFDAPAIPASRRMQIGRYFVEAKLGEGGVGIAYRAWDPILKRVVALKLLKAGRHANAHERDRFQIEAEAIARISHENIVDIFDVGEIQGEPYIAMEYCAGGNLADRLRLSPLTPRAAAEIMRQVALGVAAAHRMQVIHRDLKPANVFLQSVVGLVRHPSSAREPDAPDWNQTSTSLTPSADHFSGGPIPIVPKVSDFGLAKLLDTESGHTRTSTVLGTPAYMAPEQTMGGGKSLTASVDIYALGAMLYECISGRPPFVGSSVVEILEQVKTREPASLRTLLPKSSVDLETIALKCLQKEPERRYATIQDIVDDLDRFLTNRPILARPVSSLEISLRWCRRNPGIVALASFAAGLIVCLAVALLWIQFDRELVARSEQKVQQADRDRLSHLYQTYLTEARVLRKTETAGQREKGLQAIQGIVKAFGTTGLTPAQQTELRDEAIQSLALPDWRQVETGQTLHLPQKLGYFRNDASDVYLDTDPSSGELLIRSIDDAAVRHRLPLLPLDPNQFRLCQLSPCGRWLAESRREVQGNRGQHFRIWDLVEGKLRHEESGTISPFRMSLPSDRRLFAQQAPPDTGDARIVLLDALTGRIENKAPAKYSNVTFELDPTGKYLAIPFGSAAAEIIDATNWEVVHTLYEVTNSYHAAWDPSGPRVLFLMPDRRLYEWDMEKKVGKFLPYAENGGVSLLKFSRNGQTLANIAFSEVVVVDRWARSAPLSIPGRFVAISGRGHQILIEENGVLKKYTRDERRSCWLVNVMSDYAEFSRDGNWLALSRPSSIHFFDEDTLQQVGEISSDRPGCVSFAPDGTECITFGIFSHVWRWPIQPSAGNVGQFSLGTPSPFKLGDKNVLFESLTISPHHRGRNTSWSADGQQLALVDYRENKVFLHNRQSNKAEYFADAPDVDRVAMSPDGQWLAAAAATQRGGTVWRVKDQQKVVDLPGARHVVFSPDKKWLASSTPWKVQLRRVSDGFEIVKEWERIDVDVNHPTPVAFDPNGQSLAMMASSTTVQLVDLNSLEPIANLEHPNPSLMGWLSFNHDGSKLAVTRLGRDVAVWDLAYLSSQVRSLGLNFVEIRSERPHRSFENSLKLTIRTGRYPSSLDTIEKWKTLAVHEAIQGKHADAASNISAAIATLQPGNGEVLSELLVLRGKYLRQDHAFHNAFADWRQAIVVNPKNYQAALALAEIQLFGPVDLFNPSAVITLLAPIQLALRSGGDMSMLPEIERLIGYAQIRIGQDQAGLELIKKHGEAPDDPVPSFLSALAQLHLKDKSTARGLFELGKAIQANHKDHTDPITFEQWERVRSDISNLLE